MLLPLEVGLPTLGIVEAANVEEAKGTRAVLQQRLEEDLFAEIIDLENKSQPHRLIRVGIEHRLIEIAVVDELARIGQLAQRNFVETMAPFETASGL